MKAGRIGCFDKRYLESFAGIMVHCFWSSFQSSSSLASYTLLRCLHRILIPYLQSLSSKTSSTSCTVPNAVSVSATTESARLSTTEKDISRPTPPTLDTSASIAATLPHSTMSHPRPSHSFHHRPNFLLATHPFSLLCRPRRRCQQRLPERMRHLDRSATSRQTAVRQQSRQQV